LIPVPGKTIPEGLEEAYLTAKAAEQSMFELDGVTYHITVQGRNHLSRLSRMLPWRHC